MLARPHSQWNLVTSYGLSKISGNFYNSTVLDLAALSGKNRELTKENVMLKAEIAELRAEVISLRNQLINEQVKHPTVQWEKLGTSVWRVQIISLKKYVKNCKN